MNNVLKEAVNPLDTEGAKCLYQKFIQQFIHYKNSHYHYLDSAATTQKPNCVIEAISDGYRHFSAPVHRASYPDSEKASNAYEQSREKVSGFIQAKPEELIFTKSATESINFIANGWAKDRLSQNKKIWVSRMEHNANYLPWRRVCEQTGATLKIIEIDSFGNLLLDDSDIWSKQTLLIAVTHCSNVLGGENPIVELCTKAKKLGIATLIDATQSVAHLPVSVRVIPCDFLVFSAHKMYGPEGIGALYINTLRIPEVKPLLMGGGIVSKVNNDDINLLPAPQCFEAGSPNLSGALGFSAAINFINSLEIADINIYINWLSQQFLNALKEVDGVYILPTAGDKNSSSVISFILENVHPHDVAHIAAEHGVAMRTGHHCSHILLEYFSVNAVNRISLGVYNSTNDISPLIASITEAKVIFS
jgi:cysteine desulfurase/selenocysteine lyase